VPDTRRLDEIAGPVLEARADANPHVAWNGALMQRHADLLSIRAGAGLAEISTGESLPLTQVSWSWQASSACELPADVGKLELERDDRGPVDLDALPESLTIRWRRGGERLRPRRGGPRRALKSLLQEAHVPVAARARLPLIFAGERLLAAADLWLDESVQAVPSARHRGRLRWRR
jgi:tRNA(Ile)-lysidine synthase